MARLLLGGLAAALLLATPAHALTIDRAVTRDCTAG